MIKHNVVTLLKNLNLSEISSFRRFLRSPYHNRSKKIIQLFNSLMKFHPEFSNKNFTKQKLIQLISPEVGFNDSTFRTLMHDLFQLLQIFLVIENISGDKLDHLAILLKELYKRKLYPIMNSQLKRSDKILNNSVSDNNIFYNKFLFESYRYNINSLTSLTLKKVTASKQFRLISGSDIYLSLFFITEFISDYTNQAIYKSKYNIDDTDNFSKSLIKILDFDNLFKIFESYQDIKHIVSLYKHLFDLFSDIKNKKKYEKYRDDIRKSEKLLSRDEISFHYSKLISCCILNHEIEGTLYYNTELFEIYNYFLKMKLYRDNKSSYLTANLYRTVLLNAIRLKKYKWVLNFIENFITETEENVRENIYWWSYGVYYNETGNNKKSIEFINKIKANYFIFKYDLYNIKLKIFYEYENPEAVLNFIRTYREFLRNDDFFSGKRKIIYVNFIKSVELMIKCREKKSLYYADFLKNKFLKTEKILYKDWIQQKILLLEKSFK